MNNNGFTQGFYAGFSKKAAMYKTLLTEFVKKNPKASIGSAGVMGYGLGHTLTTKDDFEDIDETE
jgi:hypothetical protein